MKRLLILSGKGGTGKTTVAASIIKLSNAKAVADCDVDAPNLHLVNKQNIKPKIFDFFGGDKAQTSLEKCIGCGLCADKCRFNAIEILNGKAQINQYVCEGCGVCEYICPQNAVTLNTDIAGKRELYVDDKVFSTATLKMGRGNSGKLVTEVKMAMLQNAPECEIAVTDGSPGIGCPVIASVSGMDLVLIVAEPSGSGVSDLKRLCKTAKTFQAKIAVAVNKYDISCEHTQEIQTFCQNQEIPFVGKIPYDIQAVKAANEGVSLIDIDCPAGRAIKDIYEEIKKLL